MLKLFGAVAFLALAGAHLWALRFTPPDALMGDVYRILFVHVPAAWMAMLLFFLSFIGSIFYLVKRSPRWDQFSVSAAELGVVLTGLALLLGSIWGKPAWGVWWTWDPRLTTTALLFIMYLGYLILRQLIGDPERRAKVAAGIGLLIFVNVPVVYLSVKWWRSLHQVQSSPQTMDPAMAVTLRICAVALLLAVLFLLSVRLRLARRVAEHEARDSGGTA